MSDSLTTSGITTAFYDSILHVFNTTMMLYTLAVSKKKKTVEILKFGNPGMARKRCQF